MHHETTITRPFLKYNGGKYRLAPWIISHFPPHSSFVDVFGGGGSIILRKPRSRYEYYNDVDGRVVNLFRQMRDNKLGLIRKIKWTPYSRDIFDEIKDAQKSEGVEGAYNYFVMNWLAHYADNSNPSYRVRGNQSTDGNYNPAGLFAQIEHLFMIAERLRGVHIENLDYRILVKHHDHKETLFYADPPYLGSTRNSKKLYKNEIITSLDHARISRALRSLKGMVIVSGYPSPLYERLYEHVGWIKYTCEARNNRQNIRTEALWINPAAQKAHSQQELFK